MPTPIVLKLLSTASGPASAPPLGSRPAIAGSSSPGPTPSSPGAARRFRLNKRLITIGRSPENDIVLTDPKVHVSHAYLQVEQKNDAKGEPIGFGEYLLVGVGDDVCVNGKKKNKFKLALGDVLRFGSTELVLCHDDPPAAAASSSEEKDRAALSAYRKLHWFSERLLGRYALSELLSDLVDAVVEITSADRGFLVLLEEGRPRIQVARTARKEAVPDPARELSDSIVDKVLRTAQPVIVSDALGDSEWSQAESVLHLRLSSVMCVPLREGGNLLGALYVGSSQIKNLFKQSDLEVLTILSSQAALILQNARLVSGLKSDNQRLGAELEQMRFGSVVSIGAGAGVSPAMQEVLRTVAKVACTDVSVLITGETGTGKELIAQEIHRRSPRRNGPMMAINCGAIPEPLLESELFGYVRGAFTGADRSKPGRFHAASGGTLFLDEIGEMPLGLQVKILRVLQERAVTRVGDNKPEPIDVRVVSATHRDLSAEIRAGRFREDLFYRLNVVPIHLPPLRERGDDILILARYFMQRGAAELGIAARSLSPRAEQALLVHPWPGNIRQLENLIKKALVLSDQTVLEPEDLGLSVKAVAAAEPIVPLAEAKERFARNYVLEVLAQNGGNRAKTARDLDVDPRTIFRFLEREQRDDESSDLDPSAS
ncbi:MAG: sigma 54-interacting transcriptional regulator [Myxococcales bacterium]|nr:sigma 54-interacting transcriptional regulator [Myxococcales bacterium]